MRLTLLLLSLSLLAFAEGPEPVPLIKGALPTGVENAVGEGRVIASWSPAGVLLRAQRVGPDQLPVELVLVRPDGVRLDISTRAIRGGLALLSSKYLLRGDLLNGGPHLRIMSLDTMTEQTLPLPGGMGPSDVNDSIALIVGSAGATASRLSVVDCASARLLGSVEIPVAPAALQPSLKGKRPLLIDRAHLMVYPILIEDGQVRLAPSYRLTGPSIPAAPSAPSPGATSFNISILGHASTRAGKDLFFIAPKRLEEGMPVVETDGAGREVGRRVVKLHSSPDPRRNPVTVLPMLTQLTADKIAFAGRDGYSYHFPRP